MTVQKEWIAYGLTCRVVDNNVGTFNGYVAIPKEHPAWGADYDDLRIEVHGGLTFGEQGSETSENWPNRELYWYGFDTCHSGDWVSYASERGGRKWTLEDVAKETETLAKQFSEITDKVFLDYGVRHDIEKYYGKDFLEAMIADDRTKMIEILSQVTHVSRSQEVEG